MTFAEFWPLYLEAHRQPATRAVHYVATGLGAAAGAAALALQQPWIFAAGIAASYALAVAAHFLIEGNRPLILVNALWGAVADLRMTWLAATGQLGAEYARLGLAEERDAVRPNAGAATPAERLALAIREFGQDVRLCFDYYDGRPQR